MYGFGSTVLPQYSGAPICPSHPDQRRSPMPNSQKARIERYLPSGEHDYLFAARPGEVFTARGGSADGDKSKWVQHKLCSNLHSKEER